MVHVKKAKSLLFFICLAHGLSVDIPVSGFVDSKTECGKEGVLSWTSSGNQLFPGKELFGSKFFMTISGIGTR